MVVTQEPKTSSAGRRRTGRVGAVVAAAAAVVTLASACSSSGGSSGSSGGSTAKKTTTVTIAYPAPVADHMVPAVAQAAGLFAKYGINAKIQFLQQSELMPALISGKVQFASLAAPGYEIASLNGSPIQAIAQWEDSFDVELVSNPKYPSMKSLNGKSIAISSPGAFSDLVAKIAMRKYDVKMNERPLGNLSNSVAAFESGSVESISDLSPSQFDQVNSKLHGAHMLVDFRSIRGVPAISFIGYQPWLQKNKQTAINVVKAINDGVAYFKSHKTQAVATIAKIAGQPTAQASAAYDDTLKAMSTSIAPSLAAEKTVLSYLTDEYPKAKNFDASKLIDTSYITAAGAK